MEMTGQGPTPAPGDIPAAERATPGAADRLGGVLLETVWFALLTGLVEAVILELRVRPHRFGRVGPQVVWMAPLVDVFVFSVLGLVLFWLGRRWPRLVTRRVRVFAFSFLALFAVLFIFHPRLYKYAGMVLAAGLAAQIARFAGAHAGGFHALVRRSLWGLVAVIVAWAAAVHGWPVLRERRALATLPDPPAGAPNVLLIILDTVRAESLSLHGYPRATTPRLEAFAKDGVRFERALSTAPWTLPSHGSMFTGRFAHELSTDWLVPLDDAAPALSEVLGARGYVTAGFAANVDYCSYRYGLSRGFAHYEDYVTTPGQIIFSASLGRYVSDSQFLRRMVGYRQLLGRKSAEQVNDAVVRWLSRLERRPFFLFLNYFDAHGPYVVPDPFAHQFGKRAPPRFRPMARIEEVPPEEIHAMVDAYDGALAYLDHHVGRLLDELRTRGELDNTVVIVTSDHGEEFGEHGVFAHGHSLYLPTIHVPLVIVFPRAVPAGRSVREPVTLRDLPATVLDLLKLDGAARLPGRSLARHWQEAHASASETPSALLSELTKAWNLPDGLPISKGPMTSLVSDGWRYIRNGDGREELYDFDNDPAEVRDYATSEEGRQALARSRAHLGGALVHRDP